MNENDIIDAALMDLIVTAIKTSSVSVYCTADQNYREYSFTLMDDQQVSLETVKLSSPDHKSATQYNVFIEDNVIASVIIPDDRKIYLPDEDAILKIFQACAAKVIFQEMNTLYGRAAGKLDNKSRTN